VWVAWQSFANGYGDITVRHCEAGSAEWSKAVRVTSHAAGDWEPRLAFDWEPRLAFGAKGAAVVFDSSRNGNYDVYLAQVTVGGTVKLSQVTKTPRYAGRALSTSRLSRATATAPCGPSGRRSTRTT